MEIERKFLVKDINKINEIVNKYPKDHHTRLFVCR